MCAPWSSLSNDCHQGGRYSDWPDLGHLPSSSYLTTWNEFPTSKTASPIRRREGCDAGYTEAADLHLAVHSSFLRQKESVPPCLCSISFISSCCIASHGVLLFCPCPSPRCTAQGAGLTPFGILVPSPCLVHSRYSIANVYWNVLCVRHSRFYMNLFTFHRNTTR